jgi:hypothetical protein
MESSELENSHLYSSKFQIEVNRLKDKSVDRTTRKQTIEKLNRDISSVNKNEVKYDLLHLLREMLHFLSDDIEIIRKMSIDLILKLIAMVDFDEKLTGEILDSVIKRLNTTPFPEKCILLINFNFSRGIKTEFNHNYRESIINSWK